MTSVGHRRKLLAAIAAFGTKVPPAGRPRCTGTTRGRAAPADGDVLRSGRLDGAVARLDPEDLREVIGAYHRCVADDSRRASTALSPRYMGDGVLVYFGYPQAQEDDAERAVRAGLALVDGVARLDAARRPSSPAASASPPGSSSSAI